MSGAARLLAKNKLLVILLAGLLIMGGVRLFAPSKTAAARSGMKRGGGPVYVELGEARFGTMRESGLYYGSLAAAKEFTVGPRIGGRLEALHVDLGDHIESGQILARLDDEQFRLARDRARHDVGMAQALYDEARANLSLARNDLERQSSLAGKRIVPQSDYEAIENKMLQAEARLEVADGQLQGAGSQLANAELELSYAAISSSWPEGGYRFIAKKMADEGDMVMANTPILMVVSLDPLLLVVEVIERDYPKIMMGQKAELRTEAWPGEVFSGTVKRISPVISSLSRRARVELEVANPDQKLKPGMFMEAVFVFREISEVWSVPQDVPFRRQDGFVIFIADPETGRVRLQRVTLGLAEKGWVELAGVASIEGPVVFLGQHLLEDGRVYKLAEEARP